MTEIAHGVRLAVRRLAKTPLFTIVALITLAVGIGANSAVFSAVNAILLKPLPYHDASRLVTVVGLERFPGNQGTGLVAFSPRTWKTIAAQCPEFESLATYARVDFDFLGADVPEKIRGALVSGNFFSVLGTQPYLGRPILPADTEWGNGRVVELSYDLWRRFFGEDPTAIGREIILNNQPYTVIGVARPGVSFPSAMPGVWVPLISSRSDSEQLGISAVARLGSGWSLGQAEVQLKMLRDSMRPPSEKGDKSWELAATPIRDELVGNVKLGLLFLQGAAGFVLLIACINFSGLLLTRGAARQRELAIYRALGASRIGIVRQVVLESIFLAMAGGVLGVFLSASFIALLRAVVPGTVSQIRELRMDLNVLVFSATASVLAGIFGGLFPAFASSDQPISGLLNRRAEGSFNHLAGSPSSHLRSAVVSVEIALSVMLVLGAGLLTRSFDRLMSVSLGFPARDLLTMSFNKATCSAGEQATCLASMRESLDAIRALPGVQGVAAVSDLPLEGASLAISVELQGRTEPVGLAQGIQIGYRFVSPQYFRTVGVPILRGRDFGEDDSSKSMLVAIVNEEFARRIVKGDPIGRHISNETNEAGERRWATIVGEVGNSRDVGLRMKPMPEVYLCFAQADNIPTMNLIVRTATSPSMLVHTVRDQLARLNRSVALTNVRTMEEIVGESVARPKFRMILISGFAVAGLILAVAGVYGLLSYQVHLRTHEIGIQMALGASRGCVLRKVLSQGLVLSAAGISVGILGSIALSRVLRNLLFEISPTDPGTFVGVALSTGVAALLACYLPARRATRIDPVVALRSE